MIDERKVKMALRTQVLTLGGTLPTIRVWEGEFSGPPSEPQLWMSEHVIPVGEAPVASDMRMLRGYVQYNVHFPRGKGNAAALALCKAIGDLFSPPGHCEYSGQRVAIDRAEKGGLQDSDEIYQMYPVRVYFRAYEFGS